MKFLFGYCLLILALHALVARDAHAVDDAITEVRFQKLSKLENDTKAGLEIVLNQPGFPNPEFCRGMGNVANELAGTPDSVDSAITFLKPQVPQIFALWLKDNRSAPDILINVAEFNGFYWFLPAQSGGVMGVAVKVGTKQPICWSTW